jgi:eukaryotic-like serine/threonine-protein kinase
MTSIDDLLHTGAALKGALGREALDLAAGLRLLAPGDRVGPFRIVGELGRGGMGVVYEAERVDGAFEQRVAIKWLLARGGDTRVAQFRRERQILAALRHPHIARLLDGGETDDGMLWFAMERIEGRAIDRYCAEQGAQLNERLKLFEQVCGAVAFAHARLLVHRDIKPSNILIDSDGSAKLVDFGIAHALDDSGVALDAFTPGFASPEQIAGAASSIATDIYSLGALLRALLHPARSAGGETSASALAAAVDLGDVAELDAIAARAAAIEIADRYATVDALTDDLRRFRRHQPVQAFGDGAAYRASKFIRRHWLVMGVAVLSLAVLLGSSTVFVRQLKGQRDLAAMEAQKANAVTDFVVDLLRSADPSVHHGDQLTVVEVIASGEGKADIELSDRPDVHARLLSVLADVQMNLSNYGEALRLNERAAAIMRTLPAMPQSELAKRLRYAAQCAWRLGRFERGLELADQSEAFNLGPHRDAYGAVSLLRIRSHLLIALGRLDEAERAALQAVATARAELPPDSPMLARALIASGAQDEARGRYEEALTKTREAAAIAVAAPDVGRRAADTFAAYGNIATYLFELGRAGEAYAEITANLAVMREVTGEDHARYIRQAGLAARTALALGDIENARRWLATARAGMPRIEQLGYQSWADVVLAEAELALHEHRAEDALAWFERLNDATGGKDRDAALGTILSRCLLGIAGPKSEELDALSELGKFPPRLEAQRERVRLQCLGVKR